MTVQTNTNVAIFNGDAANKVFPIGYKFNSAADLVVLLIDDESRTSRALTLNSDFTVTGAGDEEGGAVTLVVAPTAVQRVKVTRIVDILQLTDLRNQGKFYAEIHEDALDLLTMIAQQNQTEVGRSLRVTDTDPEPARIPPVASRAGKLLAFDAFGNPTTTLPVADSSTELRKDIGKRLSVSITDHGAVGDGVTNDLAAIRSAITEAQATGKAVYIPPSKAGWYVNGAGEELLLITQPVRIVGDGFWSWLKVDDAVPQTTDIIRLKPNPAYGELGYGFEGFSIRGAQGNGYAVGAEPGRHAIHIDLTAGDTFIGYCPFKSLYLYRTSGWSIWLSNANEAAAGEAADYVNCTPIHYTGGLFASDIEECRISSGIWLQCAGDSLKIVGGSLNGYNGIYYDGAPGAGGFKVESVNLTARGGLLINRALAPAIGKTILEALHPDMNPIGVKTFQTYFPTIADTAFIHLAGNTGGAAGSGRINSPTLDKCSVVVGGALPVGNPQGLQLVKIGVTLNAALENVAFGPDTASPLVITSNARSTRVGYHTMLGRTPGMAVVDNGTNTRRMVASGQTGSTADMVEFKDRLIRESGATSTSETREVARFHRIESPAGSADGYCDQVYPETLAGTIKRIWRMGRRSTAGALDTITEVLYFAADRFIIPAGQGFGMRDEVSGEQRFACLSGITVSNTLPSGTVVTIRGAAFGYPKSYVKTDGSNPGAWVLHTQNGVKRDTTANRPAGLTAAAAGLMYMDTTMNTNGQPIFWSGTAWVNSMGVLV